MATENTPQLNGGRRRFTTIRNVLEVSASVFTIAVSGAMLYTISLGRWSGPVGLQSERSSGASSDADVVIPAEPASLDGAQIEGSRHATVAVIEYADFQCPFCARFALETLPALEKTYIRSGKVLFAFRQFPLESIHSYSLHAAAAAECAGDQGQFWPMHGLTFADQLHLDEASLRARAAQAGINVDKFDKCLQTDAVQRVRADKASGRSLLVRGTPTFFIGAVQPDGLVRILKRMAGAVPFSQLKTALDAIIEAPRMAHAE